MLDIFSSKIQQTLMSCGDHRGILKKLRDLLKVSISDDKFRLSCISSVIQSIQDSLGSSRQWDAPPLIINQENNFSVRMIYWPSYYEVNPHEHKTWGVTGIFHNKVDVNIYEFIDNPRRLRKINTIMASQGEAGYVQSGSIHNIRNNTNYVATTLHIFNNLPGVDNPEENAIWYPGPRRFNLSSGLVDLALFSCLDTLKELMLPQAMSLIENIYMIGSRSVKFRVIDALCDIDPLLAKDFFNDICIVNSKVNMVV